MNKRKILVLFLTGVIALGLLAGIYTWSKDLSKPDKEISVAYAKTKIEQGTILKSSQYDFKLVSEKDYIPDMITKSEIDKLNGVELNSTLYENEYILEQRVAKSNLANVSSNKRLITYRADDTSLLSGQLKNGDLVDVWVNYSVRSKDQHSDIKVTEKILERIPVAKALDNNQQQIEDRSKEPSSVVELLLDEEQIATFLDKTQLGKVYLAKVPADSSPTGLVRKITNIDDLAESVQSQQKQQQSSTVVESDKVEKLK